MKNCYEFIAVTDDGIKVACPECGRVFISNEACPGCPDCDGRTAEQAYDEDQTPDDAADDVGVVVAGARLQS